MPVNEKVANVQFNGVMNLARDMVAVGAVKPAVASDFIKLMIDAVDVAVAKISEPPKVIKKVSDRGFERNAKGVLISPSVKIMAAKGHQRGRPKKADPKAAEIKRQRAFDARFLSEHPPLPGLNAANTVEDDHITIIFNGNKRTTVKRYLKQVFGITFEDYKRIYGLPSDYPAVAPNYSRERQEHAVNHGLGTDRGARATVLPMKRNDRRGAHVERVA